MLVTNIPGLNCVCLGSHFNNQIRDFLERNICFMRAVPASPANMITNTIFWNTAERVIQDFDLKRGPFAIALNVVFDRKPPIINLDNAGIVNLDNKSRFYDCAIFFANSLCQRPSIVFLAAVVFIRQYLEHRGRDERHKYVVKRLTSYGHLQVSDVPSNVRNACKFCWPRTDQTDQLIGTGISQPRST